MKATWIFLIVLMVILVGCTGGSVGPVDPPVVVITKQPKVTLLTISPDGGVLPYGDKAMISWSSENADYCLLNNETVKTVGFVVKQLFADTNFILLAKTDKLSSSPTEKSVKVGDWTTSRLGLLTYKDPWMLKNLKYLQDGQVVADLILTDEEKTDTYFFTLEGKLKYCKTFGVCNDNEIWSFSSDETCILMGKDKVSYLITNLVKNELVFNIDSNYNGKPAKFEQTYWRSISQ